MYTNPSTLHKFNFTADSYLRHPNSYLPKYIASETDGENVPLTSGNNGPAMQRQRQINGLDIGPHQIVESDDEDIPPYGFPSHGKRRNRRDGSDIDLVLGSGGKFTLTIIETLT